MNIHENDVHIIQSTPSCMESVTRIIYPCLIVVFCLLYSSIYFFNTYPVSEGWNVFNAELVLRGNVPYRDFYYYLPPLNLFIDIIFWKLSFGKLLVYRGWYLAQRILILLLMYRLLSKHFKRSIAFFSVIITSVVMTACVYDLFGDYNQTMVLLSVCLLYPMAGFVETMEFSRKRRYMRISGVIVGLMFLNKQTIFAATVICCFVALVAYCIKEKDVRFFSYFLSVAVGFFLPLFFTFIYLMINGTFVKFLEQVFIYTDGKGKLLDILLVYPVLHLMPMLLPSILLIIFFVLVKEGAWMKVIQVYAAKLQKWVKERSPLLKTIIIVLIGYIVFLVIINIGWSFYSGFIIPVTIELSSVSVIRALTCYGLFAIISGWFVSLHSKNNNSLAFGALIIVIAITSFIFARVISFENAKLINKIFFSGIRKFILPFFQIFSFFLAVYCFFNGDTLFSILLIVAFSLCYSGNMASGKQDILPMSVTSVLSIELAYILSTDYSWKKAKPILSSALSCTCAMIMLLCFIQKQTEPYEWWGHSNNNQNQRVQETSIPALSGVRVTAEEQEMFEEITHLIVTNTSTDDEVWGYPYIKLFNILADRYTMNTFVPVLFPDVVSDRYVEQAITLIQKHNPKIVLWKKIPKCLTTHEHVFRNGVPLKQRKLERMFTDLIPERYATLGYYNDVEIYCLKDDDNALTYGNIDDIIQVECDIHDANYVYTITNPLSFETRVRLRFKIDESANLYNVCLSRSRRSVETIDIDGKINDGFLDLLLTLKKGKTELLLCCAPKQDGNTKETVVFTGATCVSE